MFRGVGQAARLYVPIISADDIERLQNDRHDNAIDQNELQRSREELIAPEVTDDSIKEDPANNVAADIKQSDDPIVLRNLCEEALSFMHNLCGHRHRLFPCRSLDHLFDENI